MATTINASTSGLIETSDGTAVLDLQTGGTTAIRVNATQAIGVGSSPSFGSAGQFLTSQGSAASPTWTSGGSGTVTSVGWTGGIVSIATATTTPAFTITGTSGGIPYFSGANAWASSAALTQYGIVYGGGAGNAPVATAAGTTGQFLGANTGGAPTWQAVSAGSAATATTLGTVYGYTDNGAATVSLGYGAAAALPSGNGGTAVGYQALTANSSGVFNTAIGHRTGPAITSGSRNTFLGAYPAEQLTTGSYNSMVGFAPGFTLTTGSNNICIGYQADVTAAAASKQIVIGDNILAKGDNTAFIGGTSGAYNGANSAAWAVTSDRRIKKNIVDNNVGLNEIKSIQVRNFEYCLPDEVDPELSPNDAIIKSGVQLGVIAQELQAVLPDCVKQESTGVLSVNQDNLTWYTINAIKQLSAALDAANARIAALEAK
jgi:hypothetical protein